MGFSYQAITLDYMKTFFFFDVLMLYWQQAKSPQLLAMVLLNKLAGIYSLCLICLVLIVSESPAECCLPFPKASLSDRFKYSL